MCDDLLKTALVKLKQKKPLILQLLGLITMHNSEEYALLEERKTHTGNVV